MTPEEMAERDILEFADEEGNTLLLQVRDTFFYNGEEFAALQAPEGEGGEDDALYIMKINAFTDENGEEMEEFVMPDEDLLETLIGVYSTRFDADGDE